MRTEELRDKYLEGLIRGDKSYCYNLIKEATKKGMPIKEIYNEVFFPAMVKVGDLWEDNRFSVAQEHLATAITQTIISGLYDNIFDEKKDSNKGAIILSCAKNELHELGARMLADLLELDGWDVMYLGANTPNHSMLEMIKSKTPMVVALACTMKENIQHVKELVGIIKDQYKGDIKILVGGMAFNINDSFVQFVNADYHGRSYDETLGIMNKIFNEIKTNPRDEIFHG